MTNHLIWPLLNMGPTSSNEQTISMTLEDAKEMRSWLPYIFKILYLRCFDWEDISNTPESAAVSSDFQTPRSSRKYSAARRIYNSLLGIWKSDKTLSLVEISWEKSKLALKGKTGKDCEPTADWCFSLGEKYFLIFKIARCGPKQQNTFTKRKRRERQQYSWNST